MSSGFKNEVPRGRRIRTTGNPASKPIWARRREPDRVRGATRRLSVKTGRPSSPVPVASWYEERCVIFTRAGGTSLYPTTSLTPRQAESDDPALKKPSRPPPSISEPPSHHNNPQPHLLRATDPFFFSRKASSIPLLSLSFRPRILGQPAKWRVWLYTHPLPLLPRTLPARDARCGIHAEDENTAC